MNWKRRGSYGYHHKLNPHVELDLSLRNYLLTLLFIIFEAPYYLHRGLFSQCRVDLIHHQNFDTNCVLFRDPSRE